MKKRAMFLGACATLLASCGDGTPPAEPVGDSPEVAEPQKPAAERVALKRVRLANPEAGRTLFVEKGCVICHAVNGTGGKAAPPLDAPIGAPALDPLEFAARMWRGAPAMIELQSVELGYTIYLTATEIADLAAFANDRESQKLLTEDSLPPDIKAGLLDQRFWEMEDWEDILRQGREGVGEPESGLEFEELPVDPD